MCLLGWMTRRTETRDSVHLGGFLPRPIHHVHHVELRADVKGLGNAEFLEHGERLLKVVPGRRVVARELEGPSDCRVAVGLEAAVAESAVDCPSLLEAVQRLAV